LLKELGVSDGVTLQLNTLGDADSRDSWRVALIAYFQSVREELSEDSQDRLERNPLRILDSKDPRDRAFVTDAPKIDDYLTPQAEEFFGAVTAGLDAAGVQWARLPALVRGLDYYRHTAFEFVTDRLGAQGTVLGGGRYDGLIESLGGPHTPAVGWAAGIERLAMLVGERAGEETSREELVLGVVPDSTSTEKDATRITTILRRAGIAVVSVLQGSIKKRADKAKQAGANAILFVREPNHPLGRLHISHFSSSRTNREQDQVESMISHALQPEFGSKMSGSGWNNP